jgi:hypothetical protein
LKNSSRNLIEPLSPSLSLSLSKKIFQYPIQKKIIIAYYGAVYRLTTRYAKIFAVLKLTIFLNTANIGAERKKENDT